MNLHITTPFGRRSVTPAQIRAQTIADSCPPETTVHKWTVFRDIAVVRTQLNLTDRALAVLDALLTFHPETALTAGHGPGLVVFPSNAALALRAHGIAGATLRRHLAALVEAGLVIRRDSPNGKRYVRRGQGGAVTHAYGFDLMPLVARAGEFAEMAEAMRAASLALRVARERVTLLRRDCAKLIHALEELEGASAMPLRARYRAVVSGLPRMATLSDLEAADAALSDLVIDVGKLLTSHQESAEMSTTRAHDERHNQNSKPDTPAFGHAADLSQKEPEAPHPRRIGPTANVAIRSVYPLGHVLAACPDVEDFAQEEIRTWRDLAASADLARAALGISPDAWHEAQEVMGVDVAAVTVAAILQRAERIASPGGYLRALVERKRRGEYSLGPVLQALNRAQLGERLSTA